MLKVLSVIVLVIVLVLAGVTWLSLTWVYSDGERAGYVQKFSRRGWVCKTWEGEMAMVTMPGTMSEKFAFTVRDPAVAAQLNEHIGRRLTLHYDQHKWIPSSCFGETEYWVTGVKVCVYQAVCAVICAPQRPRLTLSRRRLFRSAGIRRRESGPARGRFGAGRRRLRLTRGTHDSSVLPGFEPGPIARRDALAHSERAPVK
jgi:hypothetical protein